MSVPIPGLRVSIQILSTFSPSSVDDSRTQPHLAPAAPLPSLSCFAFSSPPVSHLLVQLLLSTPKARNIFIFSNCDCLRHLHAPQECLGTNLTKKGNLWNAPLDATTPTVATCQSPTTASRGHLLLARKCTNKCHLYCSLLSVSDFANGVLTSILNIDSATLSAATRPQLYSTCQPTSSDSLQRSSRRSAVPRRHVRQTLPV